MTVKSEWVEATRYELAKSAMNRMLTTYGALYDRLRDMHFPSWPSRKNGHTWMHTYLSPILSEVGTLCRRNQEPLLTALVVSSDTGKVGTGYASSVFTRYDYTPESYTLHAEIEAGKCFRHFGGTGV